MSADSPNHSRPELTPVMQNVVTPQPVTDPTILDSVAGFINEVVPTTGNDSFDSKDQIQWARFENLEWDESNFSPKGEFPLPSSLILVLGYTTGVQVWAIPANGEAIEIFSWRHGAVKVLRILPAPYDVGAINKRDVFASKRPLIALVDVMMHGSSGGSLNFYSLKTGEQVKQIKFKNPIVYMLANRRSVVIAFSEKIAIFDAFTLEDKLSVTACYLSPGIQPNPMALGPRWLAFAEKKLIASRRSSGGNEGEGVQSYTATVLHAAKSLGRGLRELGDAVASSLTGNPGNKLGISPNSPQAGGSSDIPQKGIVTILDIENPTTQNSDGSFHSESVVAHFIAHTEAIVCLQFGPCGMLLLTADKRGHDFNLFRINPHPVGSALAAVHHLYTLHRGDTSARVQDMCFSFDSRWVTVSTLRGTTHVFPITPYGGNIGVRTHTTPHVVNKMSRFHRSAGLTIEGRSNSPISMYESPVNSNFPYHNPRFTPFPHPTVVAPLAQLRQPVYMQNIGSTAPRQGRQRLSSSSEDNIALRVTACFAPARAWIDSTPLARETTLNKNVKPVESLFVMNCHGTLVQYDLEPHHASNIPKDRICDDTPVELSVTAKAQWLLQRQPTSIDRPLPLPHQSLIFVGASIPGVKKRNDNGNDDDWLSQVEIITHAGPHRRLWMGPQFTFKTYTTANGTPMSLADAQPLDLNRSKPVNMPITKANTVLIESSSASSSEQSLLDIYKKNCEELGAAGEHQIKEDLADAMIESPGAKEAGGRSVLVSEKTQAPPQRTSSATLPIAKVVNPLGTVVTVQSDDESDVVIPEDIIIYENCDETLFRPLVNPKTLVYSRSSKADSGNIMVQSLRGDTEVTVRVMDKTECHSGQPSSWEDPKFQDIRSNTKVIVKAGEVRDLMAQSKIHTASDGKIESKSRIAINETQDSRATTTGSSKSRRTPEKDLSRQSKSDTKGNKSASKDGSAREVTRNPKNKILELESTPLKDSRNKSTKIGFQKTDPRCDVSDNTQIINTQFSDSAKQCVSYGSKLQGVSPKQYDGDTKISTDSKISKYNQVSSFKNKVGEKVATTEPFQEPQFEETSYGLVNPLYNILEGSEHIKADGSTNIDKNKESISDSVKIFNESEVSFTLPKVATKSKGTNKKVTECGKDITDDSLSSKSNAEDSSLEVAHISPELLPIYSKEVKQELDFKTVTTPNIKISNKSKKKIAAKNESSSLHAIKHDIMPSKAPSSLLTNLDEVKEISFTALDSNLVNPDFPPLEENFFSLENLTKTDRFEDAQDCGLPLESTDTFFSEYPCKKLVGDENYVQLVKIEAGEPVSSDAVSTSEDNVFDDQKDDKSKKKASSKKLRKPKAKLGVKIGSACREESPERPSVNECNPDLSYSEVSAEIILPTPKRSWSSIAAAPTSLPDTVKNDPWCNNNNEPPIKTDSVETYTMTLFKKPHTTVTTEKLLDIDTPEERSRELNTTLTENLLDIPPGKGEGPSDLHKSSDKSSDDEKNDSGSSPIETTESSDEGKVAKTVVEPFDDQNSVAVSITSKPNGKRKIKKKKK